MRNFYKNHYSIYNTSFTTGTFDTLISIAFQCPLQGGKAVYKARAALRWVNDSLVYNDEVNCQPASSRKAKFENALLDVSLVANPLSDQTELRFTSSILPDTKLQLYSAEGKIIFETILPPNTVNYKLNMLKLNSGIYLIKISNVNFSHKNIKLIVN